MFSMPKISLFVVGFACILIAGCGPEETGSPDTGTPGDAAAKGECINPQTGERDTTVECLVDPCSTASCEGDPDATCEANYCGGCHAVFTAADGSDAQCEPVACTADAMLCPDGSSVGRDPESDCAFAPCPNPKACDADAKVCPDGTTLVRDPEDDCQFPACPEVAVCVADVKECADGSYVSRDPANDCAFELCEGECENPETGEADTSVNCFADPCSVTTCAAHPDAECTANYCGGCHALFSNEAGERVSCEQQACTADAKQCPDGSWVGRDGSNACEWKPCP